MTPPTNYFDDLAKLEDRAYATFRARLKASERLATRGQAWNASLYAFSFSLAFAAIGTLGDGRLYGPHGDGLMAGLAVLALVASLIVGQFNYAVRSRDMQVAYKDVQFVSQDAEYLKKHDPTRENFQKLTARYQELIRGGENHTSGDHWRGKGTPWGHLCCYTESLVTFAPLASLAAPILVLIPLIDSFFG